MGNKWVPIDPEERFLGMGMVRWTWFLPWCCWGCRKFGAVEVVLPKPEGMPDNVDRADGTTDDELMEKIDRAHKYKSDFCFYNVRQLVIGRVYRLKGPFQEKIYLRAKGEKEEDVRPQAWPPWTDGQ